MQWKNQFTIILTLIIKHRHCGQQDLTLNVHPAEHSAIIKSQKSMHDFHQQHDVQY